MSSPEHISCDVAIIGAGTAGLAARKAAIDAGAKILLIDNGPGGTTCARVGCMPSKLLIAAGNAAQAMRDGASFGIEGRIERIDGPAVMARVQRERDHCANGVREKVARFDPSTVRHATARFTGPTMLALDDGSTVEARAIVIASGSRPAIPEMLRALGDRVLTNETVFELSDIPRSLAVVGAGSLGLELAQAFARLGSSVAVFDQTLSFGGIRDPEVAEIARTLIGREMTMHLETVLQEAHFEDRDIKLHWSDKSGAARQGVFSHVLAAAGRPPNLSMLDLDKTGLALDDHGIPLFNPTTRRCGNSPIFVAGDVAHDRPVLHEASFSGKLAGENAAHYPQKITSHEQGTALGITFTDPNIASIGLTGKMLPVGHIKGTVRFNDQGRARVENRVDGIINLYADPSSGLLLGAELACPAGEHLAHLIAWAIQDGRSAEDLLAKPFYHPTYEEGLRTTLREICHAQKRQAERSVFEDGPGC